MIRRLAVVAAALAASVLLLPVPASAHGEGAKIALNSDGLGAVWLTVEYTDGHEVDGPIEGTISAREEGGATVDAQQLVASSAPGLFVYMGTLAAGQWSVRADLGTPIHRSCTASFAVSTTPKTTAVSCDPPDAVAAAPAPAEGRDWVGIGALVAAAALAVGLGAAALLMRRRRQPPPAAPAARKRVGARP